MRKEGPPMRRAVSVRPRMRSRLRILTILVLCGLVLMAAYRLDTTIQPLLQEFAEYETQAATVRLMNAAITRELVVNPECVQNLYTVEYSDDGSMRSVVSNPYATNLARGALVDAVTAELNAVAEQKIDIPLGSLLDSAILNNWGPCWTLTIQPEGYVDGELNESVEPVAINQVVYRIDLRLTTSVNMILDGRAHVLQVETTIPLVHVLLEGTVPDYYAQNS